MKNTTKMMVIAVVMLAIAALFVAPAAARVGPITNVNNTDTIFVWETGLDLTGVNVTAGANFESIRKYTDSWISLRLHLQDKGIHLKI